MKRSLVGLLLSAAVLVVASGCAATARRAPAVRSNPTVALAITVNGGEQPTPAQFLAIQKAVLPAIDAKGWVFVTDYTHASHIVRIDFMPSINDPENSGRATVLSVRANPLSALATHTRGSSYPAGFAYTSSYGYGNSFYGYDRYDRFYDSYYSYYTPVTRTSTTPAPATMPTFTAGPDRHRGDDYCPPGELRPPAFANIEPASSSRSSSWRGDSSYSRSEPSYSRAEPSYSSSSSSYSGYSRSEPSYSSSSSSYSSSSSSSVSSSYSAPTMSSYSASESVSSSSSSSSSGSGSSASTDTNAHQN